MKNYYIKITINEQQYVVVHVMSTTNKKALISLKEKLFLIAPNISENFLYEFITKKQFEYEKNISV